MKLPAPIKTLLTLRNPAPILNPSAERLHRVFDTTLKPARSQGATNGWLVLSTAALLGCNSPTSVGHLYRYIGKTSEERSSLEERVSDAAVMRESLLKGSIFVGVAMTINAMASLMDSLETDVKQNLRTNGVRQLEPSNIEATIARGNSLWKSIYRPHADKLQNKLGSYHPDFPLFILQAYGNVLSPLPSEVPRQGNLNRVETSLVGIATLRAMEGVGPQLISHVYGLMKARDSECDSNADHWLASDEGAKWALESVDQIVDATRSEHPTSSKL